MFPGTQRCTEELQSSAALATSSSTRTICPPPPIRKRCACGHRGRASSLKRTKQRREIEPRDLGCVSGFSPQVRSVRYHAEKHVMVRSPADAGRLELCIIFAFDD